VKWWWDPKQKRRSANSWIPKSYFRDFKQFKDNVEVLEKWKKSKFADKKEFFGKEMPFWI
jgi:hypothetical protein